MLFRPLILEVLDVRSTRELPITCIATGDQIFMALIPIEKVRQKLMQCAKTPFV